MLFIRQEHIMRCFPVLFWLISLLPVAVQGEYQLEKPIKAQVGSDVILPCLVKPPVNVRDAAVEWMFDSSKTVHLFRNEADDRESQDDRYKGRTYLNHTMLELGNISLKLSNVTKNDEGIYSCFVHRLPDLSEEKHVTLIVVDGKENENPDKHSGGKYHLVGPEEPIKAQVGSDVILPCLVELNASSATVEWIFNSSKTVHLFRNEADDRESQDDRYKDRTYLNHAMLELGNISLKLSNVTKNDAGIYSCFVHRLPDLSEEKHVTLIVVDGKENENPDKHSGGEYQLEKPIKAQVGSDVILPCLVELNASSATVEWIFNSSKTVHLFRHEADDQKSQDDRYKDRTYLNHTMLELGDISLKLSNVTKNDEGIYMCSVRRLPVHNKPEEGHVTLVVVDGKENENPDKHSGGPEPGVIGGVVVGALIILAFITYYVVRRHRGEQIFPRCCNKSQNEQRRNYGDHRGNGNQGDGAEERPLQNLG
ncbi:V-set domain containing T-cell activation inhibitor 1-like isoform X1 [Xiphophorus couchianus]|uniref:V-set domain containing T-cell activation inhibitor 1-like isoform X1 n=1 Tax=Xiphophorus couchianus TaxID=32473 RepID=UPI0010168E9E|nr:V-set domain containing T-cell activation inhibitor 1-like isoform X1 [Xiphophorus couchianus]